MICSNGYFTLFLEDLMHWNNASPLCVNKKTMQCKKHNNLFCSSFLLIIRRHFLMRSGRWSVTAAAGDIQIWITTNRPLLSPHAPAAIHQIETNWFGTRTDVWCSAGNSFPGNTFDDMLAYYLLMCFHNDCFNQIGTIFQTDSIWIVWFQVFHFVRFNCFVNYFALNVSMTLLGFITQSSDQGRTESTDIYCWPVRLESNTSIVWSDLVWYYKDIVYIARAGKKVLDCTQLFSIKCWRREISKILTLLHK